MIIASYDVGRKNLACCVYDNTARQILFWHIFNLGDRCRGTGVHREMYRQFDNAWGVLGGADLVLVERQPRTNPQMRVIEAIVEAYFVLRGKRCVDYSSRHKLAGVLDSSVNTYTARKRASVQATRNFLEENALAADDTIREVWRASKKKDDLGDAFLQAFSYRSGEPAVDDPGEFVTAELERWIPRREPKDKRNSIRKLYTRCQVKWFFTEWFGTSPDPEGDGLCARFVDALAKNPRVRRTVEALWPSVESCVGQMCKSRR
jgi:hypothetical protein